MKSVYLSALLFGCGSVMAFGATINVSNNNDPNSNLIVNTSNQAIPNNTGIIAAGYLNSIVSTVGQPLSALVADFRIYGNTDNFGGGTFNFDGLIDFTVNGDPLTSDPAAGKHLYILMGNGSTIANSNEFLIWDSGISFSSGEPFSPTVAIVQGGAGSIVPGAGELGPPVGGTTSFKMVLIPEPSVALLGGLGILGLVARRRRN